MELIPRNIFVDSLNESNASQYGKPVTLPKKGEVYVWCMGAEPLDIKYVGIANHNPEIKPSTTIGKGFIFQYVDSGKYIEVSSSTIKNEIAYKED